MMIDGTCFEDQQVVVAIGLTLPGHKVILGLHQGATENATVVKHLPDDIGRRGVDFEVPRLYVLDGGKALHAAVRKAAGQCAVIQRCHGFAAARSFSVDPLLLVPLAGPHWNSEGCSFLHADPVFPSPFHGATADWPEFLAMGRPTATVT